jgi:hypothetical protein
LGDALLHQLDLRRRQVKRPERALKGQIRSVALCLALLPEDLVLRRAAAENQHGDNRDQEPHPRPLVSPPRQMGPTENYPNWRFD